MWALGTAANELSDKTYLSYEIKTAAGAGHREPSVSSLPFILSSPWYLRTGESIHMPPIPSYLEAGMMSTPGHPSRATLSPQGTDHSVTGVSSPLVAVLYDDLRAADTSATEFVSNIRSFIHSSSRITAARNLRGEEAQGLIDLIDQVSGASLRYDVIKRS